MDDYRNQLKLSFATSPVPQTRRTAMIDQKYSQYLDPETGAITRPAGWDDPFGDAVWRTSWFYSSLVVIRAIAPEEYANIASTHDISASTVATFLSYFRDHC